MIKGIFLALLAAFSWGSAIVMSKLSLDSLAPAPLFFYQILFATIFSWCVQIIRKKNFLYDRKSLLAYSTGIFEPLLAYLLTLYGMTKVQAGIVSIIYSLESVFILLLSVCFLRTKIKQLQWFITLLLLAMLGSLLVVLPEVQTGTEDYLIGYLFVLTGVFSAAVYVVISSRLVGHYEPLTLLTGQLTLCTFLSAIYLLVTQQSWQLPVKEMGLVAISGIVQYFLAFFLWLYALRYVAVHLAGVILYFIPVIALTLSWLFLGETINIIQGIGMILTIFAIYQLNRKYEHS